ncbi:hypothetical protein ACFL2K_03350 [Candidatus Margulisiibacteriota bacterium]
MTVFLASCNDVQIKKELQKEIIRTEFRLKALRENSSAKLISTSLKEMKSKLNHIKLLFNNKNFNECISKLQELDNQINDITKLEDFINQFKKFKRK